MAINKDDATKRRNEVVNERVKFFVEKIDSEISARYGEDCSKEIEINLGDYIHLDVMSGIQKVYQDSGWSVSFSVAFLEGKEAEAGYRKGVHINLY